MKTHKGTIIKKYFLKAEPPKKSYQRKDNLQYWFSINKKKKYGRTQTINTVKYNRCSDIGEKREEFVVIMNTFFFFFFFFRFLIFLFFFFSEGFSPIVPLFSEVKKKKKKKTGV